MSLRGPDEVLEAPTETLVVESLGLKPNPRRKRTLEESIVDLYAGNEKYLVRTALIRAADYNPDKSGPIISDSASAARIVEHLKYADQEHLVILCINGQGRLMAIHETAIGGTSSASQELKHIVKVAVLVAASAVLMAHNHPGGDPTPSPDDVRITLRVKESLDCIGLKLFDHIVVGQRSSASKWYASFNDLGLMDESTLLRAAEGKR